MLLTAATQLGYAIPGTVLGLSLILLYNNYLPWIYGTSAMVVLGYLLRYLPQAVQGSAAALAQVDPNLEDAARGLGRSGWRALREVTLPLIRPGMAAGWILVFISSMKELAATLLLRPPGFDTLPVRIWIATTEGLTKLLVELMSNQTVAIRAFERMGFERVAVLPELVKDMAGRYHDLMVLIYDLAAEAELY